MAEFNTRVKHKRDTSANWTSKNPVLLNGELILVDTAEGDLRFKIGDGTKSYTQLPFTDEVILGSLNDLEGELTTHSENGNIHVTTTQKSNWDKAYTHSQASHAPSNAEKNQNAFSKVVVGSTTIEADTPTDSLTFVEGDNVTLTPDASGDKVTISAKDTVYTHPNSHPASMITGLSTVATSGSYSDLSDKPTTLKNPTALTVGTKSYDGSTAVSIVKSDLDLGNVENKSSATIRGEITSSNVTTALGYTPLNSTLKGVASGLAELDSSGKVPSTQLPSYVDDVIEGTYVSSTSFKNNSGTAITGETGKIYVDTTSNKTYRWSGSAYVEISSSLALGETSATAYRGDRGKTAYDHSQITGNPHGLQKSDLGLSNVENKSSAAIRGELTKANVTTALGYTPPTTDTTYGVVSTTSDGLAPKRDGSTSKFLRADGTWAVPPDNDTKYEHPTYTNKSNGLYKITVDSTGHISTTSSVQKSDITGLGIPAQDTTYGIVSTTAAGLAPVRDGSTTKFLRADGSWATPPDTKTTVDSSLSSTSTNPVQNKVVNSALSGKSSSTHTHDVTVTGSNSASTVTGSVTVPTVSPSTTKISATASGTAVGANGTATAITGFNTHTTAAAITDLNTTTIKNPSVTAVSIPNVTGNTSVTASKISSNSSVTATKINSYGSLPSFSATVNANGVLSFSFGAGSLPTGSDVTATNTAYSDVTATNTTLGTALSASKVTTTDTTVVTGAKTTADAITALGTPNTVTVLTGVKVTTQPTITVKSGTTGDVTVVSGVSVGSESKSLVNGSAAAQTWTQSTGTTGTPQ